MVLTLFIKYLQMKHLFFSKVFDTDKSQRSFNNHYFKRNGIQGLEIQMQENMDQKNTEYGHLLCSE